MLELKNVSKSYTNKQALSFINLSIHKSEFIGLIGANGAGKSTLMKVILGLVPDYDGELIWKGQRITQKNLVHFLKDTKALIETPQFFPSLTGKENLEYFAKLDGTYNPQKIKEALNFVNLFEAKDKRFCNYSLGMKQKLGIARVFIADCSFLILDEPFNGLDPLAKEEMKQILKRLSNEGKTLLVSSHLLEELEELSTRILFLEGGILKEDINWNIKFRSSFEISIDSSKLSIVNELLKSTSNEFEVELIGDNITVTIERSSLPSFLKLLIEKDITFYEVTDVTRQLKKYFNKEGEIA